MSDNIEVVTLQRGAAAEDGPWVTGGGHRVHAPWPQAESEVKARVLRTLASRSTVPDGVAFVRGWDQNAVTPAQVRTFDGGNGITQSGSFGPAAEMAAAARVAQGGPVDPECKPCGGTEGHPPFDLCSPDAAPKPRGRRGK